MRRVLSTLVLLCCLGPQLPAADKRLTAVVLYEGGRGAAYAVVSDLTLNEKREVYVCDGFSTLDKDQYRRLPKIPLLSPSSLRRAADGSLVLATSSGQQCVVPLNLKLEGKVSYQLAGLAAQTTLQGKLEARSSNSDAILPPFRAVTEIHFTSTWDTGFAEYLRARSVQSVAFWKDFLRQFGNGPHGGEARTSLARLLAAEAEREMSAFRESSRTAAKPSYEPLRRSLALAEEALRIHAGSAEASALKQQIQKQVGAMLASARLSVEAFRKSLNEGTPGYARLQEALTRLEDIRSVDPMFAGAEAVYVEARELAGGLEQAVASAEALAASRRFDEAYRTIARYRQYAAELPRIQAIIDRAFQFRLEKARALMANSQWEAASKELQTALSYKEDAGAARELLTAESELAKARDRATAEEAVELSQQFATQKKFIEAYDSLSRLTASQRAYVGDQMAALEPGYRQDLLARAQQLVRLHLPIRGVADQEGARQAWDYLRLASELNEEDVVQVRMDVLGERISQYYLERARELLAKPRGSGAGLAWHLLQEAQRFQPDAAGVRDLLTQYAPLYETRAKLSVAIQLRDLTSRRDSLGFADQLADTVAAGLEASGLPGIKVLPRSSQPASDAAGGDARDRESNFLLLGDILQHQLLRKVDLQGVASRYRASQREVKNPAWVQVNNQVQELDRSYQVARELHQSRAGSMNKRDAEASQRNLDDLAARREAARRQLLKLDENLLQDVILPYNYTRRTIMLTANVEVAFRLAEPNAAANQPALNVRSQIPKQFILLEDVSPHDVEGVVAKGTLPDENQVLAQAEREVQDQLVAKLIEQLKQLPARMLTEARNLVNLGDQAGAAEKYIQYLNSTTSPSTPERTEALGYLKKEFGVASLGSVR
ncbi:MAG: hypothetical protein ACRD24_01300 [Terriglobales bacterium]